jgi:hypothetical protein
VHDQRFAVDVDDRLEERGDEVDFRHGTARRGTAPRSGATGLCVGVSRGKQ